MQIYLTFNMGHVTSLTFGLWWDCANPISHGHLGKSRRVDWEFKVKELGSWPWWQGLHHPAAWPSPITTALHCTALEPTTTVNPLRPTSHTAKAARVTAISYFLHRCERQRTCYIVLKRAKTYNIGIPDIFQQHSVMSAGGLLETDILSAYSKSHQAFLSVSMCVWEREREREWGRGCRSIKPSLLVGWKPSLCFSPPHIWQVADRWVTVSSRANPQSAQHPHRPGEWRMGSGERCPKQCNQVTTLSRAHAHTHLHSNKHRVGSHPLI